MTSIDTVEQWLGEDNRLGIDIWHKKYQRHDESFPEWLKRVSGGDTRIAQLIEEKKFLFGGRILANRGIDDSEERVTYSNCYVVSPPEDSLESIYDTCYKLAKTYAYGGGCGVDISKMAPEGARVHNQARTTSGAVSFMPTFNQVTAQIGQDGRRGALMISIDDKHPDLEKFITIKSNLSELTSANISIRVSDAFMQAVLDDADWELSFTREETGETISKTIKAKSLFMRLAQNNWDYGEPGILFWDRIKSYNLLSNNSQFEYAGVNPCGEEPLPAGGSCLLGSINLAEFVDENGAFDFDVFGDAVYIVVSALNHVLDEGLPKHPLSEQRDSVRDWRQIGLGIMGLADMLIKMGLKYGSDEAVQFCDTLGSKLASFAIQASCYLAEKTNSAYPKYDSSIMDSTFFIAHYNGYIISKAVRNGMKNSQLLTVAPTGTLSTMLGISGGIEPIYANSYQRMTKSLHGDDISYEVFTPIVKDHIDKHHLSSTAQLPEYFVTAHDLRWKERIDMQAAWQRHIDASISSTVNLPHEATIQDVADLYMYAWKSGLKGITVFRDGCKRAGILTTNDSTEDQIAQENTMTVKRGDVTIAKDFQPGFRVKLTTGCGSLYVHGYFGEDGIINEVFFSKGSSGGCLSSLTGLSRMISLALRGGIQLDDVIDQLESTMACSSYTGRTLKKHDTSPGSSCPKAIGFALQKIQEAYKNSGSPHRPIEMWVDATVEHAEASDEKCPECGALLYHESGCMTCKSCGFSYCG